MARLSKKSLCAELTWRRAALLLVRGNGLKTLRSHSAANQLFSDGLALARASLAALPRSADAALVASACLRRVSQSGVSASASASAADDLHDERSFLTTGLGSRPDNSYLLAAAGAWAADVALLPWSARAIAGATWSRTPPTATLQEALGYCLRAETLAKRPSRANAARIALILYKLGRMVEVRVALSDMLNRRAILGEEQECSVAAAALERSL